MKYHEPVLLTEAIAHLKVKKDGKYIDCTLGDGGHTLKILQEGGIVLGLDMNEEGLQRATERISSEGFKDRFTPKLGNFKDLEKLAKEEGFDQVDGILYDLGYSSYELDEGGFGLSFLRDEPLDMRLDKNNLGVTAADLVNVLTEKDLAKLLRDFSDERFASRIARGIVKYRNLKKIQTTKELAELISSETSPGYERGRIHPATRTFQALRIAVNDEISNLETSLPWAARLLLPGGMLVIITFHSLEDRVVKFLDHNTAQPMMIPVLRKPIVPSEEEVINNSRSRSAKLRAFERI